jgi:hypothetical protein
MHATAGSARKSYKSGKKESQKYGWKVTVIRNFMAISKVAVVFTVSGSEGLQGSGNTDSSVSVPSLEYYYISNQFLKKVHRTLPDEMGIEFRMKLHCQTKLVFSAEV